MTRVLTAHSGAAGCGAIWIGGLLPLGKFLKQSSIFDEPFGFFNQIHGFTARAFVVILEIVGLSGLMFSLGYLLDHGRRTFPARLTFVGDLYFRSG